MPRACTARLDPCAMTCLARPVSRSTRPSTMALGKRYASSPKRMPTSPGKWCTKRLTQFSKSNSCCVRMETTGRLTMRASWQWVQLWIWCSCSTHRRVCKQAGCAHLAEFMYIKYRGARRGKHTRWALIWPVGSAIVLPPHAYLSSGSAEIVFSSTTTCRPSVAWLFEEAGVEAATRTLSLIHLRRCRRIARCKSRWAPYHCTNEDKNR